VFTYPKSVCSKDGTLVVYGGMSREPIQIPPGMLIFKNISVKGFWLTGGFAQMKDGWKAKERLVDHVVALFRQKVIRPVLYVFVCFVLFFLLVDSLIRMDVRFCGRGKSNQRKVNSNKNIMNHSAESIACLWSSGKMLCSCTGSATLVNCCSQITVKTCACDAL